MDNTDNKNLSFADHLEELRWHILRSGVAVLICLIVAFASMAYIFDSIVLAPSKTEFVTYRALCSIGQSFSIEGLCVDKIDFRLQSRQLAGQFTMHLLSAFIVGFIVAFPYVFWEFWRFVKPGLLPNEQKAVSGAVVVVTLLFLVGIVFGYFVVAPMSIQFLANYKLHDSIENFFDISSYVSTLGLLVLGCGLIFQLPVLVFFLTKLGIVSAQFLKKFRRQAIVGVFIISAIITPSPDILTQLLVAIPLLMLYEVSIWVAAYEGKKQNKSII